ncbi:acetate--CoA ligase family protein [Roseomonas aeriglobus]|nr:acetate--CoA ligase family protein [Roseomonas aeriglobus]
MGDLDVFFQPRSIAFVGASDDPQRIGGRPLAYSLRDGFEGAMFPINPGRKTVQGLSAWPSLDAVPETIDLTVLAIPAAEVPAAVRAAGARGARGAVILSSGFAEIGAEGAELQAAMLDAARENGMRVIGPNSLGLIANGRGVCATFSSVIETGAMLPGKLAIVSQSGAYGAHLAMLALARGIGISRFVTTGNEADVTLADCIAHMADDPAVDVIGCYSEGIDDGRAFLTAVERARRAGKPIVMMKVGRSADGRAAAQSHTASVAGDDAVFSAAAASAGIVRVDTTQEFVDLLYTLDRRPPVGGSGLGIITVSGGAGVLMADAAAHYGFRLPPLGAAAQSKLKAAIPFGSATNPVDTTAQAMNDLSLVGNAIRTMIDDAQYDAVVGFFMNWPDSPALGPRLRAAIADALDGRAGRTVAVAMNAGPETIEAFDRAGMLVFDDPSHAIRALAGSRWIGEALAAEPAPEPRLTAAVTLPTGALDERQVGLLLSEAGVPMAQSYHAADSDAVAAAVAALDRPAVLKILSPDIAHKSDIGGVVLNLTDADTARRAAETMLMTVRAATPDVELRGFLVGPMERGEVELLLGGRIDPVFGPIVVCGLGGIFVEIFHDVAIGLAPIDPAGARRLLQSLHAWPLLNGARGRPAADVDAAAEAIAAFSRFVAAQADDITSVEINPLLVRAAGLGVVGLDAAIERRTPQQSSEGSAHG